MEPSAIYLLVKRRTPSSPNHAARTIGCRQLNRSRSFEPKNGINDCSDRMEDIEPNVSPRCLFARLGLDDELVDLFVHLLGEFSELTEGVRRDAIANGSFSRARDKICDDMTNGLNVWDMSELSEKFVTVSHNAIARSILCSPGQSVVFVIVLEKWNDSN